MGKNRKKTTIKPGDLFAVPLKDGRFKLGQVLGPQEFGGFFPCALLSIDVNSDSMTPNAPPSRNHMLSSVSLSRIAFDTGDWPIIGSAEICLERMEWPNAIPRARGDHVGARLYDAGVGESFLNAYYGMMPWDSSYDPHYFDAILFTAAPRPLDAVYLNRDVD